MTERFRKKHEKKLLHPYYRYGFEHPVPDPWEEQSQLDWKAIVGDCETTIAAHG